MHEIPKDMTAEELVSCGRYPYQHWWTGVSTHDRDVIRSAMQRTNTLHLKDRLAANLSGGTSADLDCNGTCTRTENFDS